MKIKLRSCTGQETVRRPAPECEFEIDTTDKRTGKRAILSEIGVFKVNDSKIVKEHYFMW